MTTNTSLLSPTILDRADEVYGALPYFLDYTRDDVYRAIESAISTVYYETGIFPDVAYDGAWATVYPYVCDYIADDVNLPVDEMGFDL